MCIRKNKQIKNKGKQKSTKKTTTEICINGDFNVTSSILKSTDGKRKKCFLGLTLNITTNTTTSITTAITHYSEYSTYVRNDSGML